jgi:diguanylate cyclase (GGDEF)-like protein
MHVDAARPVAASYPRRRASSLHWRTLLRALALGAAYAGIYKLVLLFTSFGTSAGSPFWPASGLTVSVLLLRPRREWPYYLAAIFIADFTMDVTGAGFSVRVGYGIAAANCAEPLLSATLLRRWLKATPDVSRLRDLGLFYVAAAACGPLLSATISSSWQALVGGGAIWPFAGRWYIGDALGVVVIAPLILALARTGRPRSIGHLDAALLGALLVAAALALPWHFAARIGLPFVLIPVLTLIATRIGTVGAALGIVAVGLIVEGLTAAGVGAFAAGGPAGGLLSAQMYLIACSVSGLTAAALMAGLISRNEMALHDSLTGVANRRLLLDRFALATSRLTRTTGTVGLVFVDLDGFKGINDRHGHTTGDHVLVETARRLRAVVRVGDTVARLGGDEFVILVAHDAGDSDLAALADRVREAVAEPIDDGSVTVRIEASTGWTSTDRADERAETVLARADAAMYAVKRSRVS